MKILINDQLLEANILYIHENECTINTKNYSLKSLKFPELTINLDKIINSITDGLIKDLSFEIADHYDGISIQYLVSKNKTEDSTVKIGRNLLSVNNDCILAIFIAHEIGHILYSQNELDFDLFKDKAFKFAKLIIAITIALLCIKVSNHILSSIMLISLSFISEKLMKKIDNELSKKNNFNSEFFADTYAVKRLGDPKSVVQALELIKLQFGDSKDSMTHPTITQRIKHIKQTFWFKIMIQDVINFIKNLFKI